MLIFKLVKIIDWIFPIVLMENNNGKLQMCIDYQILNRNIQKDHFLLSFINIILNEMACHKLYTFIDGYSKYNPSFNNFRRLSQNYFHHTLEHIHICDDAF
jgi:hypothetical protein